MSRPFVFDAVVLPSAVALAVGSIAVVVGGMVTGHVHPVEALVGASVSCLFFASTGLVASILGDDKSLMNGVIVAYALKILLLGMFGYVISQLDFHRTTLAVSMVLSAVLYLFSQSVAVSRSDRLSSR